MLKQYGVRMYSEEFREMTCDEFYSLLAGMDPDTPLGKLVQIRSENDPKVLEHYTPAQHKIRNDWRAKHSQVNKDEEAHKAFLDQMESFFASL
nr:hypothetical protein [uncultured Ruminococcus sp.]